MPLLNKLLLSFICISLLSACGGSGSSSKGNKPSNENTTEEIDNSSETSNQENQLSTVEHASDIYGVWLLHGENGVYSLEERLADSQAELEEGNDSSLQEKYSEFSDDYSKLSIIKISQGVSGTELQFCGDAPKAAVFNPDTHELSVSINQAPDNYFNYGNQDFQDNFKLHISDDFRSLSGTIHKHTRSADFDSNKKQYFSIDESLRFEQVSARKISNTSQLENIALSLNIQNRQTNTNDLSLHCFSYESASYTFRSEEDQASFIQYGKTTQPSQTLRSRPSGRLFF